MTYALKYIRFRRGQDAAVAPRAIIALVALMVALGVPAPVYAGGQCSARSMSMGGAFLSLAKGIDAAHTNPANLGLSGYQQPGLEIIGVGIDVSNNSLSLNDYNRYTGAVLTTSDKEDILGKIPSDGLHLVADVEATALAASFGSLVFTTTGVGVADVNLSKDIIDLALNGNYFGQEVTLTGSYSDAVAYIESGFSYGRAIYSSGTRQLAVGGSVRYLRGLAVEQITKLEGSAQVLETGFAGAGHMIAQTATGGAGYSVDLGAALKIDDNYTVGMSIRNFLSSLSWSSNTEEHGYLFNFDTMTVDNMDEDYVVSEDYSHEISGFSTNLPSVMTIGFANTSGELLWAIDWEQGFRRAAGASSKPRLAAGVEWTRLDMLPLRAGVASGGDRGTNVSFGTGLHLGGYHLDLAAVTGSSLSPGSARGVNFAIATGVDF